MPTLNWIGKEAVEKHHKEVPFRLLEPVEALSCGDADSGNLIVQGDNLDALKALLPRYAGKVKCIYIDPPYNTGNEGWVYNDNVNSPEIKKWLGEVVGKEGETLDRHDRWLCMMYPRLLLLKQFLKDDGVIFVSIDDTEVGSLRLLMDEIFGTGNFIANFVWEKRKNRENRKVISMRHDYIICYGKNKFDAIKTFNQLPMNAEALARYVNIDNDPRGLWKSDPATAQSGHGTKSQFYTLTAPNGKKHEPPSGRCWIYTEEVMNEAIKDNRIFFGKTGNNVPRVKTYLDDKERGLTPESILFAKDVSTNEEAKKSLKEMFDGKTPFETPKPMELIHHLITISTSKDSIIMDSFAGSGSTAHAVLKLNSEDNGNRKFIIIEMDKNIAKNVTAERVKKAVNGYTSLKGKKTEGLGGGFQYFNLSSEPLFKADGPIRSDVTFEQLAEFVWFMETGTGLNESDLKSIDKKDSTPYLGQYKDRAIFLLYNDILKDKSDAGGNVLNGRTLDLLEEALPDFEGQRIVYGARTRFDKTKLARLNITFHQLPYELAVKTWF
ncbi:site-specific DNA-methyltransferase [Psychrobacter sp. NPDC077938]|uniref:site-specific DNA-methyltransferase n=1 Tax=Psychrobacter sp. NPDC077938 TaxID=3364494 RepID=UPI0037CBF0F7